MAEEVRALVPCKVTIYRCNGKTILVYFFVVLICFNPLFSTIQANINAVKKNKTQENISERKLHVKELFVADLNPSGLYNNNVKRNP